MKTMEKETKKPVFNFCLKVILPMLLLLTVLVMALTYRMVWKACNDVSKADQAIAESGILYLFTVLESGEEGSYYEVSRIMEDENNPYADAYIAFRVTEEQRNEIPYLAGSYYPTAYWYGEHQVMDLSGYSVVEGSHWADAEADLNVLDAVRVYDFSAYKGHTQAMGRGGGLGLIFFWLAELLAAAFLLLLDVIGGIIIICINRERRNSSDKKCRQKPESVL